MRDWDWFEWIMFPIITLIILGTIGVIVWAIWFRGPGCDYPNHLVYTGWHWQLVGKVMMQVNDYNCVR